MASTLTLYGIKNCDTIKKARTFLDQHQITYLFHDYRVDGISPELIEVFFTYFDWSSLINKRGTTWRKLDAETQHHLCDTESAKSIMVQHPSIIKRPILLGETVHLLGFDIKQYQALVD